MEASPYHFYLSSVTGARKRPPSAGRSTKFSTLAELRFDMMSYLGILALMVLETCWALIAETRDYAAFVSYS